MTGAFLVRRPAFRQNRNLRGFRLKAALRALLFAFFLTFVAGAHAAETIPPAPPNHFNDLARLVRPETAAQLNRELAQLERDSSNQILVAIYPRMQSDSSVDDYAVRVAQSWRVGQKAKDNGAVLFVFQQSRDVWITTGYGLEGALPDALCKQIIENEIIPRFRTGDFDGGLAAGVRAMIAATRGEYRGSGGLAADARDRSGPGRIALFVMIMIIVLGFANRGRRGTIYGRRGRRSVWFGTGGGHWGGGSWGGGGGRGFGGGTFSGGGGSFGGGGAGGKW